MTDNVALPGGGSIALPSDTVAIPGAGTLTGITTSPPASVPVARRPYLFREPFEEDSPYVRRRFTPVSPPSPPAQPVPYNRRLDWSQQEQEQEQEQQGWQPNRRLASTPPSTPLPFKRTFFDQSVREELWAPNNRRLVASVPTPPTSAIPYRRLRFHFEEFNEYQYWDWYPKQSKSVAPAPSPPAAALPYRRSLISMYYPGEERYEIEWSPIRRSTSKKYIRPYLSINT